MHTKRLKSLAIAAAVILTVGLLALLHYHLPRGEVVTLTGTEVMRFRGGVDEAAVDQVPKGGASHDVRLVYARSLDRASVRSYRNEDAIWYGKFDSGTLTSQVQAILSDQQKGQEVFVLAVTQGWRVEWMSMYPNLLSVMAVEKDYVYWPLHAAAIIVGLLGIAGGLFWLGRRLYWTARGAAQTAVTTVRDAVGGAASEAGKSAAARAAPKDPGLFR